MSIKDNSLITETNQQYYQGAQPFLVSDAAGQSSFVTNFNTDLVFGSYDNTETNYALNNFKLYTSYTGLPGSFIEYTSQYEVSNNTVYIGTQATPVLLPQYTYVIVQLKTLSGGNYGNQDAYGDTVENNYGGYKYIKLDDLIENFMIAYVGKDKLISSAKRTDIIFHAKRGLQEFSYDTLKSIYSQELTVPASLSIVLPQDYVNYVNVSWIDTAGVKRPLFPTNNLTTIPYNTPVQDATGIPVQDNFGENVEGTSITEERWKNLNINLLNNNLNLDDWAYFSEAYGYNGNWNLGQFYGTDPQYANVNGYFTINEREGKMSFSSDLADKLIIIEYVSDGLAYDSDSKIPKIAEEAMYAYILYAIISTRINQPEYIVQRLKKEKRAKLRNAKIRLSNIKLSEFVQVMRGKSKWIKH
tara:strand:- start:698 stop:1939 length:1242 start_codon:yes stop_codon:yes gene_type:complete